MRAKIKDQQKGKQSNKQSLVRPNKVVTSGVVILSRGDVVWRRRRLLSCLLCEVLCVEKGFGFNYKIMIKVQDSPPSIMVTRNL